jgi:hypothetical protein
MHTIFSFEFLDTILFFVWSTLFTIVAIFGLLNTKGYVPGVHEGTIVTCIVLLLTIYRLSVNKGKDIGIVFVFGWIGSYVITLKFFTHLFKTAIYGVWLDSLLYGVLTAFLYIPLRNCFCCCKCKCRTKKQKKHAALLEQIKQR